MEQPGKVSICVLTYNRCEILRELLRTLSEIGRHIVEIIVIDNHSSDETEKVMKEEFPRSRYFRMKENIGAGARNVGLKEAKGEIIITLDDDVIGMTEEEVNNLIGIFENRPNVAAVNFRVTDYYSGAISNWVHHCRPEEFGEREFETYEITEGAVAFRSSALGRAGHYPEYFFISHEGPDLALRLMNHGYAVIYSPRVSVKHKHSNLGRKAWLNYYYDTRNHIWLAARNFPWSYAATYLVRGLGSMLLYSLRDGYFRSWVKALFDGLKGLPRALNDRQVVSPEVMQRIWQIDKERAGALSLLRERLLKNGARL